MNTDDVIKRTITIITEYYANNLEPFFESIAEDVLWIGPAEGQNIRGRENVIDAWNNEVHELTFTMSDIKAQSVAPVARVREVLLQYDIFTHYPSGNTDMHKQQLHCTWRERRQRGVDGWVAHVEIVMLQVSNLWKYDPRDTIYPVHYETLHAPSRLTVRSERSVTVKATDQSFYRLLVDNILYIETVKRAARLIVHTKRGPITINGTLPAFERDNPGLFVRIHASYLVNPDAVRKVSRFRVRLEDDTELPVPEKKYTQVKRLLLERAD